MKKQILLTLLTSNLLFANDNQLYLSRLKERLPQTVGLKQFPSINGERYNGDCSGFVAFLFHVAGLNLKKLFGIGANGVRAVWNGLDEHKYILDHQDLQAGDIVFFDNTYDMNKDGLWNDELSHIGVVENIDEFGTISYVHYGSRGVVRASMNLQHPDTFSTNINGENIRFNDLLRNSSKRGVNPDYLSGNLYRGAARIYVQKK